MSANRHAAVVVVGQAAPVLEVEEDARLEGAPLLETGVNPVVATTPRPPESSDISVSQRSERETREDARAAAATVTLFVYGWHQVQPGALSWVFPSLRAALDAVRTMRNAVEWCICSGETWDDLESARAGGAVLIEQLG